MLLDVVFHMCNVLRLFYVQLTLSWLMFYFINLLSCSRWRLVPFDVGAHMPNFELLT